MLVMNREKYADVLAADAQIVEALREAGAEYVVMAGYMRKVTSVMLDAFPNRVLTCTRRSCRRSRARTPSLTRLTQA